MNKVVRRLGLVLMGVLIGALTTPVFSQELPTLYRGIRPLGMGGAFTAVSDDANALFYNPAGLSDTEGIVEIEFFNPQFEISQESFGLYEDLVDADGKPPTEVINILDDHIDEKQHSRFSVFPNVLLANFGFGVLVQGTADVEVRDPISPEVDTNMKLDVGLIGGGAYDFGYGLIAGIDLKLVHRRGSVKTFTALDVASGNFDPFDDLENKFDYAFDVGGLVHLEDSIDMISMWDPTLGVVFQNITNLDFDSLGEMPAQLNVGIAIHPNFGVIHSTLAYDVMDVTRRVGEDDDFNKRSHLGVELEFPMILTLRIGYSQSYVSAGVTFDIWIVHLDYATYAEEVGIDAGDRDDRRHVIMLGFGI